MLISVSEVNKALAVSAATQAVHKTPCQPAAQRAPVEIEEKKFT